MSINVAQIDVAFLIMITKKVKANLNVLGSRMQHRILGNTYGTHAITMQRHMMKFQAKIPQSGHHLKQLRATASRINILNLCSRLGNARLFARRPRNQSGTKKTDKSRKWTCDPNGIPQKQHLNNRTKTERMKRNTINQTQE